VIIDFHTHVFPPDVRDRRDDYIRREPTFAEMYTNPRAEIATAEDLLASMDESSIDISVALGFAWRDPQMVSRHNDYLLDAAAKSHNRILAFCTVNMADPNAANEIERCANAGARGLGELRPDSQGWPLSGEVGETLAALSRRFGLMLLFHVTEPDWITSVHAPQRNRSYPGRTGCELKSFRDFTEEHYELPIVGAHLGGGLYIDVLVPLTNPFVDTAAQPFLYPGEQTIAVLEAIPSDRVLFGSDYPLITQSRQIAELRAAIPDEARLEAALGGNAEALIGRSHIKR
jgi:uncharacterized protein